MLRWATWCLAVASALKAVDAFDRVGPELGVAWTVAAIVIAYEPRWAVALVPLTAWSVVEGIDNEHMYLLAWLGVVVPLAVSGWLDRPAFGLALRVQASIVYGFAGFSKINPDWLSGDRLGQTIEVEFDPSTIKAMAFATVAVELWMALAVWRFPLLLWLAGIGLHGGMVWMIADDTYGRMRLATFGLLMFALYPLDRDAIDRRCPRVKARAVAR